GSTSCTTSEKPCLTRFCAIGPPIAPRPMKPTVPDMIDRLPGGDRRRRKEPAPGTIPRPVVGGERGADGGSGGGMKRDEPDTSGGSGPTPSAVDAGSRER